MGQIPARSSLDQGVELHQSAQEHQRAAGAHQGLQPLAGIAQVWGSARWLFAQPMAG